MRYVASTVIWAVVSVVWGIVGTLIGPGIAVFIVSLICGAVGAVVTCAQQIGGRKVRLLPTATVATLLALGLSQIFVFSDRLVAVEIVLLAFFVSVPAFLASFFVSQLARKNVLR